MIQEVGRYYDQMENQASTDYHKAQTTQLP
jgi:hypothetical protein